MPVTVDVVQGERQGRPVPRRQSAPFAAALFEALEQQPALDVEPPARRVGHKELVEGHRGASGHDLPAAPGRVPRLLGEPEGGDALRDAVPGVVIRLHQRPVIAARAAVVDGGSQSPGVVADRRLGEPEPARHVRPRQALREEALDLSTRLDGAADASRQRRRLRRVASSRIVGEPVAVVVDGVARQPERCGDLGRRVPFGRQGGDAMTGPAHEHMFAFKPDGARSIVTYTGSSRPCRANALRDGVMAARRALDALV